MIRPLATLFALLVLFGALSAQSLNAYLELRKKHKITQAVGTEALETFVGARTFEVKGVVQGTLVVNGKTSLFVERTDGGDMTIDAENVPDWLNNNQVAARLLIHATREDDLAPLEAKLLGAALEDSIAAIEKAEARKAAEAAAKAKAKANSKNRGGLTGAIGSRGKTSGKDWNLPANEATSYYAGFIKGRNKRLSDADAWRIAEGIIGFSVRYGVDARLILAMVMVESGFNPNATSRAGAQGLGQLMPGTARGMGITDAYDTYQNLYGTVRSIRGHLERQFAKTGDGYQALILALASYNAGSGNVRKYGGIPPFSQTQNYIRKVTDLYYGFMGLK